MFLRLLLAFALTICALAWTACAAPRFYSSSTRYAGPSFAPRPDNYPIHVTDKDFTEPYVALGEVTSGAYDDRTVEVAGREELCQMARRMGGDGIVRLSRTYVEKREVSNAPEHILGIGLRDKTLVVLGGIVVRFKHE